MKSFFKDLLAIAEGNEYVEIAGYAAVVFGLIMVSPWFIVVAAGVVLLNAYDG